MTQAISNSQAMCEVLIKAGEVDRDLLVLTSDSRGSGKLVPFATAYPKQIVEVGIAEQNLVSIAAGLAHSGKHPFAVSPAAFLSMRSIEQIKVDVAYSATNVKLVGISGGVSYGALGMSHHSLQDFAVTRAIPGLEVYCPADRFETERLFEALLETDCPAYIRLGRNPVTDVHASREFDFELGRATVLREGKDVLLIGLGETVASLKHAAGLLEQEGIKATVLSLHSLKPLDKERILHYAQQTGLVLTAEEHSIYGGLGSAIAELLAEEIGIRQRILAFPDEELIAGTSAELFDYYGLTGEKIADQILELLERS